jgi:hypothetical protein
MKERNSTGKPDIVRKRISMKRAQS